MCRNSNARGQTVYIDTSGASTTEKLTRKPLCTCHVTIQHTKFFNMNIDGVEGACNSYIKVAQDNGLVIKSKENCKETSMTLMRANEGSHNMSLQLYRRKADSTTDFCIDIRLGMHSDYGRKYILDTLSTCNCFQRQLVLFHQPLF